MNLDTLENRRKELTKRFAMNGIMSNTLNDLFPRNDPKHKMERRKKEKEYVSDKYGPHTIRDTILREEMPDGT